MSDNMVRTMLKKNQGKMKRRRKKSGKMKFDREAYNSNIRRNRKDIERGITKKELFQAYWQDERVEFCKSNGINPTGKTTILVNRIYKWLDDPTQNGYKPPRRSRKRRGRM